MRKAFLLYCLLTIGTAKAQQPQYVWVEGHINPDGTFTAGCWTVPQGPGNPYIIVSNGQAFSEPSFNMPIPQQHPTWTPRYTPEQRAKMRAERKRQGAARKAKTVKRQTIEDYGKTLKKMERKGQIPKGSYARWVLDNPPK